MPAHSARFGATAVGHADLKGSAGMPPLRQAAILLTANGGQRARGETRNFKIEQYGQKSKKYII